MTFKKRQKEQVRLERRQEKVARKLERKATKGIEPEPELHNPDAELQPGQVTPETVAAAADTEESQSQNRS